MAIHPAAICALIFLSVYSYFVYPLVLAAARMMRRSAGAVGSGRSRAPGNELFPESPSSSPPTTRRSASRAKLENSLDLDYPADRLEIIVASDASTDGTDDMVAGHAARVMLARVEERKGKEHAQRQAIRAQRRRTCWSSPTWPPGFDPDALRRVVRNFDDPDRRRRELRGPR